MPRDMFNPFTPGLVTLPAFPASTVAETNQSGQDVMCYIYGGTFTVIQLTPPGGAATQIGTTTPASFLFPSGWQATYTYSVAPTARVAVGI